MAFLVYFAVSIPPYPLLYSDSGSYMTMRASVPVGYPILLRVVYAVFQTYAVLPVTQAALFVASVWVLYWGFSEAGRTPLVAALCGIALLASGQTPVSGVAALSESVYVSALLGHVGLVLAALARERGLVWCMAGISAAIIPAVRPAGRFVPLCLCALLLVLPGRRMTRIAWTGGAFLLATACIAGATHYLHQGRSASLLGSTLLPHIAFLFRAAPDAKTGVEAELDSKFAAYRAAMGGAETSTGRCEIEAQWFDALSIAIKEVIRGKLGVDEQGRTRAAIAARDTATNALLQPLALRAIASEPRKYLGHVWDHLVCGWQAALFQGRPASGAALRRQYEELDATAARVYARDGYQPGYHAASGLARYGALEAPSWIVDALNLSGLSSLVKWTALASFVVALAAMLRGDRRTQTVAVAYVGLLSATGLVLTVAIVPLTPRYAIPIEALAIVCSALGLGWALSSGRSWWAARPADGETTCTRDGASPS